MTVKPVRKHHTELYGAIRSEVVQLGAAGAQPETGNSRQAPIVVVETLAGSDGHSQWRDAELSLDRTPADLVQKEASAPFTQKKSGPEGPP